MVHEDIYRITENVEYDIIDKNRRVILGSFKTEEAADGFLINNPIYRRPEIKIIPTLTHRDMKSLDYLMTCASYIYDLKKKNWADNKVLDEIIRNFVDKIDVIRSDKSVRDYMR